MIELPVEYRPDSALHPGRLLKEELAERGMTQKQLALLMQRPPQVVNQIIREKKSITPETALDLEKVLGVDARFWTNLQSVYDLMIARQAEDAALESRDRGWLKRFPVKQMIELDWLDVEKDDRPSHQLRELLKFFAIPSFDALPPTTEAVGFRVTQKAKVDEWALSAWLRQGEREAEACEAAHFDRNRFRSAIDDIRALTAEPPDVSWPQAQQICADAGVVLIAVPHLPKTGANGVTRWLKPQQATIQLNLRYRWADIFWFNFFHEAHHVLQHETQRIFINLPSENRNAPTEVEADHFAADTLIPSTRLAGFIESGDFGAAAVEQFAREIDLHPGIVVGRLQNDDLLPRYSLNSLRERWRFADPV